jgi:hypothetical protein
VVLLSTGAAAAPPTKKQCLDAYTQSQPLRRQGELKKARENLLVCSRAPCPAALQADCMGWLKEVGDAMSTVVPAAQDSQHHDLVEVRVWVDGELLTSRLDGRALELDPGRHVFRFEREGTGFVLAEEAVIESTVLVREGEKGRVLEVRFKGPENRITDIPGTASSSNVFDEAPKLTLERPVPRSVFVLGGVGAAALGTFAYFGIAGVSARGELLACKPKCDPEKVSAVSRQFWVADIALGTTAVALGAALFFFFTRPTVSAPAVSLGVGPRGAEASVLWNW